MNKINLHIDINENKGFKWYNKENLYVKGFIFDENNNYFENEFLLNYFDQCFDNKHFDLKVKTSSGLFSIIFLKDNYFYCSCDIVRMFPIFYKIENQNITISDNITELSENSKIDKFQEEEMLGFGYNLLDGTLYNDIKQIQAGEIIYYENNKLNKSYYYNYLTEKKTVQTKSEELYYQEAVETFKNAFSRIIKFLNGKTAIVPLSGGYDSRLIATMLKMANYKDVICYTYGKKGGKDISISEKVAQQLGFKWYYIEYNEDIITHFSQDKIFNNYFEFIKKNMSFPFFQEYFAVKHLKENNLIPNNSVFFPGHSGDYLGGSHLRPEYIKNKNITKNILKKHFEHFKTKRESYKKIKDKINYFIENSKKNISEIEQYSIIEDWNFKERQSKFISNSSHIYHFFGYKHAFFYWDKELVTFYQDLPFKYKLYKRFYDRVLKNEFFSQFSLNFETELQATKFQITKQKFKNIIKEYFPEFIKRKYRIKNDWTNSELILKEFLNFDLKEHFFLKKTSLSYNFISIFWFINKIKNNPNEKEN